MRKPRFLPTLEHLEPRDLPQVGSVPLSPLDPLSGAGSGTQPPSTRPIIIEPAGSFPVTSITVQSC